MKYSNTFCYRYDSHILDNQAVRVEWLYKRASKKRAKEMEMFYWDGSETTVHPKSQLLQELVIKMMVRENALLLFTAALFNVSFSFNRNESEGTIKYFSLVYHPIIDALDNGKRVIIDELDSKLHPLLVKRIVALFNDAKTNPKSAQLLFTAHDTFLLSAGLFRRDQVWFTQKDSFGVMELYSLAEYKVRSSSPFEKEYLHGRYGATPLIGEMEEIFNPSKQP